MTEATEATTLIESLPPVVTTAEYARVLRVTPRTLLDMCRRGEPGVARPLNPKAKCGFRFSRDQILVKLARA